MRLALVWLIVGIAAETKAQAPVDGQTFSDRDPILLVFDLKDDNDLKGALIVNSVAEPRPTSLNVAIPFGIEKPTTNERAAFRTGTYDLWTLFTFAAKGTNWPQRVSFNPKISVGSDQFAYQNDPNRNVFLVAQGQLRYFTYRYPSAKLMASYAGRVGEAVRGPDAIVIDLPQGSQEMMVSNGLLSIPARLRLDERVFSGFAPSTGETMIQIAYQVPATNAQKLIVNWGLKFLGVIVPLIGLYFLPADKIRRPRWRKVLYIGGGVLAVAITAAILWAASKSGALVDAALELTLLIAGYMVAGALIAVKVKDSGTAAPTPAIAAAPAPAP